MERPGPYGSAEPGGAQKAVGYGEVDPVTGLHDWYEFPRHRQGGTSWRDLLKVWSLIELDLHEQFGVDLGCEVTMTGRSWDWLRLRILGLLSTPCRVQRHFTPDAERS